MLTQIARIFQSIPQNAKDIIKLLQLSVRLFMENEDLNAQMEQHQVPSECQSRCTLDHTEEKSVADLPTLYNSPQKLKRKTRRGKCKIHCSHRPITRVQKEKEAPKEFSGPPVK